MRNGALKKKLLNDQKIDTMAAKVAKYFPNKTVSDILIETDCNLKRLEYMFNWCCCLWCQDGKEWIEYEKLKDMAEKVAYNFPGRSAQDMLDVTEYNHLGKLEYMLSGLEGDESEAKCFT